MSCLSCLIIILPRNNLTRDAIEEVRHANETGSLEEILVGCHCIFCASFSVSFTQIVFNITGARPLPAEAIKNIIIHSKIIKRKSYIRIDTLKFESRNYLQIFFAKRFHQNTKQLLHESDDKVKKNSRKMYDYYWWSDKKSEGNILCII